jgi:hypothetical protein
MDPRPTAPQIQFEGRKKMKIPTMKIAMLTAITVMEIAISVIAITIAVRQCGRCERP